MKKFAAACSVVLGIAVVSGFAGVLILLYQGKQIPTGDPQYVAMGSSFAAGIGLGPRAPGSPIACMRTLNGYPGQLAKLLRLPLVDVSCSAATTRHVLQGGQYFQRPQLDALGPDTTLVTITSGGNDIHYVGDLSLLTAGNARSLTGWLVRFFWSGPLRSEQRDYARVRDDLIESVAQARQRSPQARIVLVTYPAILPPAGTCPRLGISAEQAQEMREVGEQLAAATRAAAGFSGALLVDMQHLGVDHHACSAAPWVNGWLDAQGAQFHPTLLGAQETAAAIAELVNGQIRSQRGTPIGGGA
jgi:lysophospholipase L1-like esterase